MRIETKAALRNIHSPRERLNVWQWAAANIDYSRVLAYETELKAPYDPEYMPYWKEPAEGITDRDIAEIWLLKCGRAGASENLILNGIRFCVAVAPQPILYMSGQQQSVERFFEKRIKAGFDLAAETAAKFRRARIREHEIYFDDMDLIAGWPAGKMAFKQSGYPKIFADEISTFPGYSTDMLRKRTANYSFATIVGVSSPDPAQKRSSSDDPIFIEFESGDQRYWFMLDPKTGKLFRFEMGGPETKFGLKWDKKAKRPDGTWDLNKVKASAHYVTPDGTIIKNNKRMAIVKTGKWVPTNKAALKGVRSYHLNSFYTPFRDGDFGYIACAFLKAKRGGLMPLRVFIYEFLAERWTETIETTEDDMLYSRCEEYKKGSKYSEYERIADVYISKPKAVVVTCDVQKAHLWAVAREWIDGGDSGLVDWSYLPMFEDLEEFANKHGATRVGIDCAYQQRAMEVYEYCFSFAAWPLRGSDALRIPFKKSLIDPFEGKHGAGKYSIGTYTFNIDTFKTLLLDMLRGESPHKWVLYQHVENEYVVQAAAEERVDGVWRCKRGHSQNHMADCETMQVVMAMILGLYRSEWIDRLI